MSWRTGALQNLTAAESLLRLLRSELTRPERREGEPLPERVRVLASLAAGECFRCSDEAPDAGLVAAITAEADNLIERAYASDLSGPVT